MMRPPLVKLLTQETLCQRSYSQFNYDERLATVISSWYRCTRLQCRSLVSYGTSTTPPPPPSPSSSPPHGSSAMRRLYRVLQRQCVQMGSKLASSATAPIGQPKQRTDHHLLLQPPVDPRLDKGPRVIGARTITTTDDANIAETSILRLFYIWRKGETDQYLNKWFRQVCPDYDAAWYASSSSGRRGDDDEDDEESGRQGMWVSIATLRNAIRVAFRHSRTTKNQEDEYGSNEDVIPIARQMEWAILAYRMLQDQEQLFFHQSSTNTECDVNVTATSQFIGWSMAGVNNTERKQYRFAYRIRLDNTSLTDTVQLLGRTWDIQECDPITSQPTGQSIRVHAPNGGVVGRLPVLEPGQALEYVSAAEISTRCGRMHGCFHMARVPAGTRSAHLGEQVQAFHSNERFQVAVKPFPLNVYGDADRRMVDW